MSEEEYREQVVNAIVQMIMDLPPSYYLLMQKRIEQRLKFSELVETLKNA